MALTCLLCVWQLPTKSLLHVSDDSEMCFSKHFNKYEQIDMFESAGKVVKTVPSSDPKKPIRLRIFKKDFALPLQKKTWITTEVYENRGFSLDRELWHEFEVPMTPTSAIAFYTPNLFDCLFQTHKDFLVARAELLGKSQDCMLAPVPLYSVESVNKQVMAKKWLVLDGRVYGGINQNTLMVKRSWQDVIDDVSEADCTPYPLPLYEKSKHPKSFTAMWDLNDGLNVYVGMEVVLVKKHQEVEGKDPITNKVTKFLAKNKI